VGNVTKGNTTVGSHLCTPTLLKTQHLADFLLGKGVIKVPDVDMVILEKKYAIKDNIVVDEH